MGYGDELIALGEAQALHRALCEPVQIVDAAGAPRWSCLWEGHAAVVPPGVRARVCLVNGPDARPYIAGWDHNQPGGRPRALYAAGWRAADYPAQLTLTAEEYAHGEALRAEIGPYVVVEPHVKDDASPNKDWGADRFQDVVRSCPGVTWVQMGPEGTVVLEGVRRVVTRTFREACGILAEAALYLGPEGGLHHAAAAMDVPAVVIFGSFILPETTGYFKHYNVAAAPEHAPCGRWAPCAVCRAALDSITPEAIAAAVMQTTARTPFWARRKEEAPWAR